MVPLEQRQSILEKFSSDFSLSSDTDEGAWDLEEEGGLGRIREDVDG